MSKTFELLDEQNPHNYEDLGLIITFFEQTIRGTNDTMCVVQATEEGDCVEVHQSYYFKDWDSVKKAYPNLNELLADFSEGQYWFASWRDNERVSYIKELVGSEGMYSADTTVAYDYNDDELEGEPGLKTNTMPAFDNTVIFELKTDYSLEEIGLDLVFFERKIQGTDLVECVVQATEQGREDFEVHEYTFADSWEQMKENFPTLKELLVDLSNTTNWTSKPGERILFIASITGHENLYDVNQTVFYDYEDESPMDEYIAPKKSTKKKVK